MSRKDRDLHFARGWDHVLVDLGSAGRATVLLSASFWARCAELRSADIGRWLLGQRLAPWPKGDPPILSLTHVEGNTFRLTRPESH